MDEKWDRKGGCERISRAEDITKLSHTSHSSAYKHPASKLLLLHLALSRTPRSGTSVARALLPFFLLSI
jgi:hypothetical protein